MVEDEDDDVDLATKRRSLLVSNRDIHSEDKGSSGSNYVEMIHATRR